MKTFSRNIGKIATLARRRLIKSNAAQSEDTFALILTFCLGADDRLVTQINLTFPTMILSLLHGSLSRSQLSGLSQLFDHTQFFWNPSTDVASKTTMRTKKKFRTVASINLITLSHLE